MFNFLKHVNKFEIYIVYNNKHLRFQENTWKNRLKTRQTKNKKNC